MAYEFKLTITKKPYCPVGLSGYVFFPARSRFEISDPEFEIGVHTRDVPVPYGELIEISQDKRLTKDRLFAPIQRNFLSLAVPSESVEKPRWYDQDSLERYCETYYALLIANNATDATVERLISYLIGTIESRPWFKSWDAGISWSPVENE